MTETIVIRSENSNDYDAISRVNDLAFNRPNEGILIQKLRGLDAFNPDLSLVAVRDKKIVGHALFFPISINTKGERIPTLSLGPVAVDPEFQNQGIGSNLIRMGHKRAREYGYTSIIVIGHPGYYPRFGYKIARIWGLTNHWNIHNEAFMAIELDEGSLDGKGGKVIYPDVYNDTA